MKQKICPFMAAQPCRKGGCACWSTELNQCGLAPDTQMIADAIAIHARCTATQTAQCAQLLHEIERDIYVAINTKGEKE